MPFLFPLLTLLLSLWMHFVLVVYLLSYKDFLLNYVLELEGDVLYVSYSFV